MPEIIECVPNFSEGRDLNLIKAITAAIQSVEGVKLLDVDPGADTNRTVVTFVGSRQGILAAAFAGIAKAAELIDMRQHHGAHPRLGATDVCPLVPVSGISEEECVRLSHELARRVAEELHIPVYLYEKSARTPERANLANIRQGEYEGLPAKLADPQWAPDYGAAVFNPKSGATVIGVRKFLIAYNVNLNTRDRKLANDIALTIREKGRLRRDTTGGILRDAAGEALYEPGIFKATKAVGWYLDKYRMAQVSINLTDYEITPLHSVFEEIRKLAGERGLRVTGSELVGLIPRQALLMAGRYYLRRQGKSEGVPEKELVRLAAQSLGLSEIAPFDPSKKIIEYQFREFEHPLTDLSVRDFSDELSSDSPAPGGGSVAALCGALAAALTAMVANLTVGKKGYERHFRRLSDVAVRAQALKDEFLLDIDRDTAAFNAVMDCLRLPRKTEAEKVQRQQAIQQATKRATEVPFKVLESVQQLLDLTLQVARFGNINSISDAGVAALTAETALRAARFNVLINLPGTGDAPYAALKREQVDALQHLAQRKVRRILRLVEKQIVSV